jgi:hypothetical protein
MTNLETVQEKLAEAYKLRATLNTMMSECAERAARLDAEYKTAVESGESDSKLDAVDDEIRKLDRSRVRVEIKLNAASQDIPTLEAERDAAARAESLEVLKEKSLTIVRAVGAMDDGISKMVIAKQEIDALLADCAKIATSLDLPTQKYQQKFQVELRRGLDWLLFRTSDHGAVWSAALREHYSMPLAKQAEKLLMGVETVEESEKIVKLVGVEEKSAS